MHTGLVPSRFTKSGQYRELLNTVLNKTVIACMTSKK